MNDKQLVLLDEVRKNARGYISSPEKASEALFFCKELEKVVEDVYESVKRRAVEQMDKNDVELMSYEVTDKRTGEIIEYQIRRDYDKEVVEANPESVVRALGIDNALPFLKVKTGEMKKYVTKKIAKGEFRDVVLIGAMQDPVVKTRKGAGVIMRKVVRSMVSSIN